MSLTAHQRFSVGGLPRRSDVRRPVGNRTAASGVHFLKFWRTTGRLRRGAVSAAQRRRVFRLPGGAFPAVPLFPAVHHRRIRSPVPGHLGTGLLRLLQPVVPGGTLCMSDLPVCRFRGPALPSGRSPCTSPLLATPAAGVTADLCSRCPFADRLPRSSRPRPPLADRLAGAAGCRNRGDVVDRREADLCGLRGQLYDVHACEIHGECVTRRTCRKQQERFCLSCDDWQTAE